MSDFTALFWGSFTGLFLGGLVGGIALLLMDTINKYIKRKSIISNLIIEISDNQDRMDKAKEDAIGCLENFEDIEYYSNSETIFSFTNNVYKNNFENLHLILDDKLINKLYSFYKYLDFYMVDLKEMIFRRNIIFLRELQETQIEKEKVDGEIKMKEKIKFLFPLLTQKSDICNKLIDNYEKIIKSPLEFVPPSVEFFKKEADWIINELKKNKINLFKFLWRYFLKTFCNATDKKSSSKPQKNKNI